MTPPDRRLNAYRPDLADAALRGRVEAERYVAGRPAAIVVPVADLRARPSPDAGLDTQLLHGEEVLVFEEREGWAWVQAVRDGYVGHVADTALGQPGIAATHVVAVPRSFVYPGPDLKLPATGAHSLGARIAVSGEEERRGTRYALLPTGHAMIAAHLTPVGRKEPDHATVAESLLNTPYLWGGSSGFGIDCSGLVQLSLRMAGTAVQRDTDMQAETAGEPLDPGPDLSRLRRGDLVFWQGHVAILCGRETIVHASGHAMLVVREPLAEAVRRIAHLYGAPTGFRRP